MFSSFCESLFSRFDINNDGRDELVLKEYTSFSQMYYHNLLVFTDTSLDFTKNPEFTLAEYRKFRGLRTYPPWPYRIDKTLIPHKNLKKYYKESTIIGVSDIEPFTYNDTYYVSIAEISGTSPNWHVVAKYTDEYTVLNEFMIVNNIEHVCYFDLIR